MSASTIGFLDTTDATFLEQYANDNSVQQAGRSMKDDGGDYKLTKHGKTNGLAGVGDVSGQLLADQGYVHSYTLLGIFLQLNMDAEMFDDWLKGKTTVGGAVKCTQPNRNKCYAGLALYCRNNL